jgi:hypothetical protein
LAAGRHLIKPEHDLLSACCDFIKPARDHLYACRQTLETCRDFLADTRETFTAYHNSIKPERDQVLRDWSEFTAEFIRASTGIWYYAGDGEGQ